MFETKSNEEVHCLNLNLVKLMSTFDCEYNSVSPDCMLEMKEGLIQQGLGLRA